MNDVNEEDEHDGGFSVKKEHKDGILSDVHMIGRNLYCSLQATDLLLKFLFIVPHFVSNR